MRRFLTAGVVAALSGCSLVTSFDGFRDDVVIVVYGGAPDAPDGPSASDGPSGPSGPGPTDAATGPFCTTLSPAPYFCSDFEDGLVPGGWSALVTTNGGSVAIEDGALVVFAPATSGQAVDARLELLLNGTRTDLSIEVDVVVDEMPEPNADLLHLRGPDTSRELSIEINDGALRLEEDQPSPDGGSDIEVRTPLGAVVGSTFVHFEWRLRATTTTSATSELVVDGRSTGVFSVSPVAFTAMTTLEVGERSVSLSGPMRARYDNLVVRMK